MSYLAISTHDYSYNECPYCEKKQLNLLNNQLLSCGYCGNLFHYCKGNNGQPIKGDISPTKCIHCKRETMKIILYSNQPTLTSIDYLIFSLKLGQGIVTTGYKFTKRLFKYIYKSNIWSMINETICSGFENVDLEDYLNI